MNDYKYDWTVMVYLSGDNNLSAEMLWAITEIERAAETKSARIALTVQYDPLSPGSGTFLYAAGAALPPANPAAYSLGFRVPFARAYQERLLTEDAASPDSLRKFIDWSAGRFESKYRMLILSGHGSGAQGDFLTDDNPGTAASGTTATAPRDPTATTGATPPQPDVSVARLLQPGSLTIPGLRKALEEPTDSLTRSLGASDTTIDVLGMDSCLMSTLEVAYEVRNAAKFLVASEGFVPNTGWPYAELLEALTQQVDVKRDFEPKAISAAVVNTFARYYAVYLPAGVSVDIASSELRLMDALKDAVLQLSVSLLAGIKHAAIRNAVVLAHWRAQSFKFEQYTDLWDFCSELLKEVTSSGGYGDGIAVGCRGVLSAINDILDVPPSPTPENPSGRGRQQCVGVDFQYARGLSVYFPWVAPAGLAVDAFQQYADMRFPSQSGWAEFLTAYLEATKRAPRHDGIEGRLFPPQGAIGFSAPGSTKNVAGYNKNVAGYNKFLTQVFGGTLPWCMKNPPQQVDLSTQPRE